MGHPSFAHHWLWPGKVLYIATYTLSLLEFIFLNTLSKILLWKAITPSCQTEFPLAFWWGETEIWQGVESNTLLPITSGPLLYNVKAYDICLRFDKMIPYFWYNQSYSYMIYVICTNLLICIYMIRQIKSDFKMRFW